MRTVAFSHLFKLAAVLFRKTVVEDEWLGVDTITLTLGIVDTAAGGG